MRSDSTDRAGVWIGYCRVSTGKQGESGLGLDSQRARLQAEAEWRGIELEVMVETGSGSSIAGRPVFQDALDRLARGEAVGMMTAKLDRLARSVSDYYSLTERAAAEGWTLMSLDLPPTEGPWGNALAGMVAVFAELERAMIAERTRTALAAAKARGQRLGGPRTDRSRELAERVALMREQGDSYRVICETLTREGEPTLRGGKEWRPSSIVSLLNSYECDRVASLV